MAALTQTTVGGTGAQAVTVNTLTSSDTFTYTPGAGQVVRLVNKTGSSVTPTITGAQGAAESKPGGGSVNYAAAMTIGAIADGATRRIDMDANAGYWGYTVGTVTIASGTGLLCTIESKT